MAEARRWTLGTDGDEKAWWWTVDDGPDLPLGESVEVAEVSALRQRWEEELLGDEAVGAAFDAGVKPARPRPEREDHRRTVRLMLQAALRTTR